VRLASLQPRSKPLQRNAHARALAGSRVGCLEPMSRGPQQRDEPRGLGPGVLVCVWSVCLASAERRPAAEQVRQRRRHTARRGGLCCGGQRGNATHVVVPSPVVLTGVLKLARPCQAWAARTGGRGARTWTRSPVRTPRPPLSLGPRRAGATAGASHPHPLHTPRRLPVLWPPRWIFNKGTRGGFSSKAPFQPAGFRHRFGTWWEGKHNFLL